ncbi:hypothetical protein BJ875DRAFT_56166 [Amylocarpus encephaloides]|uniref:Uncharacterized protein n=1 Tax=Amylocarpus encephaloides TaxID=45428 RepID=A0A9P7YS00_9HELO|nr:hypothetical protein BJ875DRAFT_56166 [Amylocarpus encephaloides]
MKTSLCSLLAAGALGGRFVLGEQTKIDDQNQNIVIDAISTPIVWNKTATIDYTVPEGQGPGNYTILLGQIQPETIVQKGQVGQFCVGASQPLVDNKQQDVKPCHKLGERVQVRLSFMLQDSTRTPLPNAFLCIAKGDDPSRCFTYSKEFEVQKDETVTSSQASVSLPTIPTSLFLTATYSALGVVSGTPSVATLFSKTVTSDPSIVATVTTAPSEQAVVKTASKSNLSLGAKVGIALGAVAVVLAILLFALFLLRRKHRQRSKPEQLMLNQSLNADSHDLITEKELSPASLEGPTPSFGLAPSSPTPSQTRHSALAPSDSIPSKPYTGSAASIPKRKPTLASSSVPVAPMVGRGMEGESVRGVEGTGNAQASSSGGATIGMAVPAGAISREVSSASSIGNGPHGTTANTRESENRSLPFEEYHDAPVYRDARHSPQVFQGGLQAPFLNESDSDRVASMSQAEIDERLREEEEERRIDAAIAEAERVKHGGQGR